MKIQEMMIKTLYDITKKACFDYPENGLERKDWLFRYPAQPILTVDLIKWTEGCTNAIMAAQNGKQNAVAEFHEFMKDLITVQVNIVRLPLDTLQRTMMGAVIVLDVHARDVVKNLTQQDIRSLNDFEWSKQLRYYWDMTENNEEGDCVVKQTNSRFKYSYEYLGNGPRLVITPLTDKCYITLTSAKHLQYGGAPAGPAGTGKTETTKDLAKALAIQCVVFNCSDGLDFKTMGRFFSGLAQGGAWACFDEFNRIDIEVLSVIAQQILTI
jgi:dynein heavy chain, axonemal